MRRIIKMNNNRLDRDDKALIRDRDDHVVVVVAIAVRLNLCS